MMVLPGPRALTGSLLATTAALVFTHQAAGFAVCSPTSRARRPSSSSALFGIRCEDKYYQLEELEDRETATTEVYLKADRNVEFGDTDGPVAITVEGSWEVEPNTDNFSMQVRRKFSTGKEGSDMGEFEFDIVREYKGEMTMVGESVAITGMMINKDDLLGDQEVGFFNMIDGTKERESYALEGRFLSMYEVDRTKGNRLSDIMAAAPSGQQQQQQQPPSPMQQQPQQQPQTQQAQPEEWDLAQVFASFPPAMQEALRSHSIPGLDAALASISKEEADYHMRRCIESGFWIQWSSATLEKLSNEEAEYHLRRFVNAGLWSEEQAGQWHEQQQAQAAGAQEGGVQQGQAQGGGGLDPNEVLETLPPAMALAFRNQSMDQLRAAVAALSTEEADYHMQRCIDAGLWR